MSYYVYGLRVKGDTECRYIGLTGKGSPQKRLYDLTSEATSRTKYGRKNHPDGLWAWLLANKGNIEAFKIGMVDTGEEGRAMEKTMIAFALRLGQRLLNVQHVPLEKHIGYIPTGAIADKYAQRLARAKEAA